MFETARKVTPKSLILDLLRVTPDPGAVPVASLVEVAQLFGFSGSALRVALMRLVSGGLVESDERGWYRLAQVTAPLGRWVEDWRSGDARIRRWRGGWLAITHLRSTDRPAFRRGTKAITRLGFKEGLPDLWVRPDNLAADLTDTRRLLEDFELPDHAELFIAGDFRPALVDQWRTTLWPVKKLREHHAAAARELERSAKRITKMARADAVVETFLRGGAAIRALALDPLLPEEIMPGLERRELTTAMLEYDRAGRAIWQELVDEVDEGELARVPLRAIDGGR